MRVEVPKAVCQGVLQGGVLVVQHCGWEMKSNRGDGDEGM